MAVSGRGAAYQIQQGKSAYAPPPAGIDSMRVLIDLLIAHDA
jgi:hypothetical protein